MTDIANKSGYNKLANMVALGILTDIVPGLNDEILKQALGKVLSEDRKHLVYPNLEVIRLGMNYTAQVH